MKVTLTGYKELDFKANGEEVKGLQLYITYKTPDVVGECADKVFIRPENQDIMLIDPTQFVGESVEMEFDRKGHLVSVSA